MRVVCGTFALIYRKRTPLRVLLLVSVHAYVMVQYLLSLSHHFYRPVSSIADVVAGFMNRIYHPNIDEV